MKLIYRWPMNPARNPSMTVAQAVRHSLQDSDPEAERDNTRHLIARLVHVLHSKGVLLPTEVVYVLGRENYEEHNGTD